MLGRPTKLTDEVTATVCQALQLGMTKADACKAANISEDSLSRWCKNNAGFAEQIRQSEDVCKRRCFEMIQKASLSDWRAAAWWLERRYPDEFSLRRRGTQRTQEYPTPILANIETRA